MLADSSGLCGVGEQDGDQVEGGEHNQVNICVGSDGGDHDGLGGECVGGLVLVNKMETRWRKEKITR